MSVKLERKSRLFKGKDRTERTAWWLVEVNPLKAPLIEREKKNSRWLDFTHYGKIIDSGYGEPPIRLL